MRTWSAIVGAVLVLASVVVWLGTPGGDGEVRARLSLAESMGIGRAGNYRRAIAPWSFSFPVDHGPHPQFRTEWWYFTGTVEDPGGRERGYQLTFFSSGLPLDEAAGSSAWNASRIFMAHLAITDLGAGTFRSVERFSRAALGLAGARAEPLRVWLDDWALTGGEPGSFELRAGDRELGLELRLEAAKPIVLQGDEGLSRKGVEPGNASYYYSITRLATSGVLRIDDERYPVAGLSWMDREWSTSVLESGQSGWDWFALQLDDGTDLMLYQLRRHEGGVDPASAGSLVSADGAGRSLTAAAFEIEVTDRWRSPESGVTYPAAWQLRLPDEDLELSVTPRLADQEHDLSVLYWEGMVAAEGKREGRPVSGKGYVELTGYGPEGP